MDARSGTYSNVNILHLTSIAEMAATQGYDLYSVDVNGKNLELAIEFLLNARENPALIVQYSKSSTDVCFSTQPPDQTDIQSVFNKFVPNQVAWMEGYIARFPFSPTAARLRQIFGSNIATPLFPMWYSYVGLNSTAAFRKPYEFRPVDGIKVAIISGYGQTVAANQSAPAPLAVRVTDNSGKPEVSARQFRGCTIVTLALAIPLAYRCSQNKNQLTIKRLPFVLWPVPKWTLALFL